MSADEQPLQRLPARAHGGDSNRDGRARPAPRAAWRATLAAAILVPLVSCSRETLDETAANQRGHSTSLVRGLPKPTKADLEAKARRKELIAAEQAKPDFPRVANIGYGVNSLSILTQPDTGPFDFNVRSIDGVPLETRVIHHSDRVATFTLPHSTTKPPVVIDVEFADRTETYELASNQLRSPGTERLKELRLMK